MSEEQLTKSEGQQEQQDPQAGQEPQTVVLKKDDYETLLNELSDVKKYIAYQAELATLEREEKKEQEKQSSQTKPQYEERDIEDLTKKELVSMIMDNVTKQVGQPLLQMLTTLAVKEEVRECSIKYDDFNTHKDEIYKEAMANINLSIEDAYHLVKSKKAPKELTEAELEAQILKLKEKREKLFKSGGEKPLGSATQFAKGGKLGIEDATKLAFEEAFKNTKGD